MLHHNPYVETQTGQYWRMLTGGFVHGGWLHLGINMFVLWSFGTVVEDIFLYIFGDLQGRLFYLLLYLAGIVFASLPTYIKHNKNPGFASLGASGAVSAVVFSSIVFAPWNCLWIYGIVPIPGIVGGIIYIGYSLWASKNQKDHIDHDAHMWGAIFGFIFTIILKFEFLSSFIQQLTHPAFCP